MARIDDESLLEEIKILGNFLCELETLFKELEEFGVEAAKIEVDTLLIQFRKGLYALQALRDNRIILAYERELFVEVGAEDVE